MATSKTPRTPATSRNDDVEPEHQVKAWTDKPHIIRGFLDQRPQYEQLCSEVAYILRKRMDRSRTEYAAVTFRPKTLNSFLEKLGRKTYTEPLKEITDFAGVRLVYLYKSDQATIEKLIEEEFNVIEKLDKVEEQDADKFGYGALHYLVELGSKNSGARYDDLQGLLCEIQVRTVLQDAWAIIDHHLIYKHESEVPKNLRRKLNSLSGSFETADDQFDQVRTQREQYIANVKEKANDAERFLSQDINLDTLSEYLKWKYTEKSRSRSDDHFNGTLSRLKEYNYETLKELDSLLAKATPAIEAFYGDAPFSAASCISIALGLAHPEFPVTGNWEENSRKKLDGVRYLFV